MLPKQQFMSVVNHVNELVTKQVPSGKCATALARICCAGQNWSNALGSRIRRTYYLGNIQCTVCTGFLQRLAVKTRPIWIKMYLCFERI